ncbi:hypothetical protein RB195_005544 [Necator americanus]|uniref:Uncharacterized protein n=1 Tax=Necator americanus TaxID=51031 RepID=A0ABR1BPZ1_NECAM
MQLLHGSKEKNKWIIRRFQSMAYSYLMILLTSCVKRTGSFSILGNHSGSHSQLENEGCHEVDEHRCAF